MFHCRIKCGVLKFYQYISYYMLKPALLIQWCQNCTHIFHWRYYQIKVITSLKQYLGCQRRLLSQKLLRFYSYSKSLILRDFIQIYEYTNIYEHERRDQGHHAWPGSHVQCPLLSCDLCVPFPIKESPTKGQ